MILRCASTAALVALAVVLMARPSPAEEESVPEKQEAAIESGGETLLDRLRFGGFFRVTSLSGDINAGDGPFAPSWRELFSSGLGGGLSVSYQLMPILEFDFAVAAERYEGKRRWEPFAEFMLESIGMPVNMIRNGLSGPLRTTDLIVVPITLGVRLNCPIDLPESLWTESERAIPVRGRIFFAKVSVGASIYTGADADVEVRSPTGYMGTPQGYPMRFEYFRTSVAFTASACAGFEYRWERLGLWLSVGFEMHTAPRKGNYRFADADPLLLFPFEVGLSYRF